MLLRSQAGAEVEARIEMENAESCHGQPVVVLRDGKVLGPGDMQDWAIVEVSGEERIVLMVGGFMREGLGGTDEARQAMVLALRVLCELTVAGGALPLLDSMLAYMLGATVTEVQVALGLLSGAGIDVFQRQPCGSLAPGISKAALRRWLDRMEIENVLSEHEPGAVGQPDGRE